MTKGFIEYIVKGEGLVANSALIFLLKVQEEIRYIINSLRSIIIAVVIVLLLRISMMFRGFEKGG